MDLIDRVKQLQGSQTQAEFARKLGIAQPTYNMILSGERRITPRVARRLVEQDQGIKEAVVDYLLNEPVETRDPVGQEAAG